MPTAIPANTSASVFCSARPSTMAMTPEVATSPPTGSPKTTLTIVNRTAR